MLMKPAVDIVELVVSNTGGVFDEGQKNMLDSDGRGVGLNDVDNEPDIPVLVRLNPGDAYDTPIESGIVRSSVRVVMRAEVTLDIVFVMAGVTLVTVVLPDSIDGFAKEVVKPTLCERLVRLGDSDMEPLEDMEDGQRLAGRSVALIVVVETMVIVVVCPPGRVLVRVVKTLDITAGIGPEGAPSEDGGIITT
jgi:hypothetical protein